MAQTINGISVPFLPVGGAEALKTRPPVELPAERSFDKVLSGELEGLTFSRHAKERLASRQIALTDGDLDGINEAVTRAGEKGGRESLVLLRDLAFVVSVPNRTVITAMDQKSLQEHVFTNIDSAIIAHTA